MKKYNKPKLKKVRLSAKEQVLEACQYCFGPDQPNCYNTAGVPLLEIYSITTG